MSVDEGWMLRMLIEQVRWAVIVDHKGLVHERMPYKFSSAPPEIAFTARRDIREPHVRLLGDKEQCLVTIWPTWDNIVGRHVLVLYAGQAATISVDVPRTCRSEGPYR